MGQTLRIGRKHGSLYELISLRIPFEFSPPASIGASTSAKGSIEL